MHVVKKPKRRETNMLSDGGDVIDRLTTDHRALLDLAQKLDAESDTATLSDLFDMLVRKLARHETSESEVLFPILRVVGPLGDVVARRRTDEHEEINELLAEMRSLTPAEPGFEKRAGALYVELESHFATEEEDLFACIRAAVSPAVLRELNYRIDAAETAAPPFPEPGLKEHIHIGPAQLAGSNVLSNRSPLRSTDLRL
jgi:iron-sulfur cluster repair protein YtfE (RIC family)